MRRSVLAFSIAAIVAACGDNRNVGDRLPCEPPAAPLPTVGSFASPDSLPLPDDCVPDALRDLPGRYFVADPAQHFEYLYPKFEGTCETGFRHPTAVPDQPDESQFESVHTWSDGTRWFMRVRYRYPPPDDFEYVYARAACFTPSGELVMAFGFHSTDGDPTTWVERGRRFAPRDEPARGLERVGGLSSWGDPLQPIVAFNVVVDAGLAYVVGPTGLEIIDVADPANPVHRGHTATFDGFNDVRVVRGAGHVVAFVAPRGGGSGTSVIDVTNPAALVFLPDLPYSHSVQVRTDGARTLLYLANYTSTVPIYDVTDPTQPVRLGAPRVPGADAGIHDLFVQGDLIYANKTTEGMVAIDVSAGLDAAVERGRIPTSYSHASWAATLGGRSIVLHGDEGMSEDGGAFMRILDGDPASPDFMTELARWRTRRTVGIHNIEIAGDKAYVAYYQDGVRILDLSSPAHPREIAHYNTWDDATAPGDPFEGALGARPGAGGLVYVADSLQGLIILRETAQ